MHYIDSLKKGTKSWNKNLHTQQETPLFYAVKGVTFLYDLHNISRNSSVFTFYGKKNKKEEQLKKNCTKLNALIMKTNTVYLPLFGKYKQLILKIIFDMKVPLFETTRGKLKIYIID